MKIPEEELLAPGHRGCAGCGATIGVRLALKVLGRNTVAVSATGCLEVITTPYPETAWEIPWIHVAFENAAAVASGVEKSIKSSGQRGCQCCSICWRRWNCRYWYASFIWGNGKRAQPNLHLLR